MNIERIYKEEANITIQQILHSLIEDKIDTIISTHYCENKVSDAILQEGKETL